MPIDRTTATDTDAEPVEASPPVDRRPPPDTPGQLEGPSRADSRVGAAAANDDTSDQKAATPASDGTEPETVSTGSSDERPPESVENTLPESEEADAARDENSEAGHVATDDAPAPATEAAPLDEDGRGQDVADQASTPAASGAPTESTAEIVEPDDAPDTSAEGVATDDELNDGKPATSHEGDDATEEDAPAKDGELTTTDREDAAGVLDESLGQADEVTPSPNEREFADAGDVVAEEAEATDKDQAPDAAIPVIPASGKGAVDLRKPAEADKDRGEASRDAPVRRLEPLTDHEYAEHVSRVESNLDEATQRGESTEVQHTLNPERTHWHPDRVEIHQQIVDDLYAAAADVPNDGQAIVAGGLGGAGKSTTLEGAAGIERTNYLTINPDDIKEVLAKRGMIPSVEGLDPMERSSLVHEESSHVARLLAARAYADRKNVIWDITMSSRSSAARRVQQLRDAGYRNVEGIFVDIPVTTSVERAEARHRSGMEDYRNGEGLGGRYVPPDVIRANADAEWGSVNRGVFEDLKPQFDHWKLYDNSVDGRGPVLLDSSDGSGREDDE